MQDIFEEINNYFDKIYILTLPRLQSRIDYLNNTLKGLNYELFFGVDKEETGYEALHKSGYFEQAAFELHNKRPKKIHLGMLACAVGHVKIYESIVENNYKKVLIMEDDVVPLWENLHSFGNAASELPDNWDVWYLGYEKNEKSSLLKFFKNLIYRIFPYHTSLRLNSKIFSNYYPKKISQHISIAGFHDCTHAYGITQEAAKKMIDCQKPVHWNPDNALAYMGSSKQLDSYITIPKLFGQLTAFKENVKSLTSDK